MSMEVQMDAKHEDRAARLLAGIAKRGMDMRPALRVVSDELRMAEDPWFRTHGGGAWLDLAETTRDFKATHGYPDDALVRTGALGHSLTAHSGAGAIRKITKEGLRFGTSLRYAKYHAIGGSIPLRNPVVPINTRSRKRIVKNISDYAVSGKTVRRRIH